MKIRVLSDLHLEFLDWTPPSATADVIVLAGDISSGTDGIAWARQHFKNTPVIYVPGNHEFYGKDLNATLDLLRAEGRRLDVTVLDGEEVVIDGVRFLGATLWTDFKMAHKPCSVCHSYSHDSMAAEIHARIHAQQGMTDFSPRFGIRYGQRHFKPSDSVDIHDRMRKWLEERLAAPFDGKTVIVTHHLPSERSVAPRFAKDILTAAFASDLTALFGPTVSLWIHGHTHDSFDYVERGTRVVCNPRGYLPQEPNPDFNPYLVVKI